jgi:hypothetical protein
VVAAPQIQRLVVDLNSPPARAGSAANPAKNGSTAGGALVKRGRGEVWTQDKDFTSFGAVKIIRL